MFTKSKILIALLLLVVPSTAALANPEGSKAKSDIHSKMGTHANYKSKHSANKSSSYGGKKHFLHKNKQDKWGRPYSWVLKNKDDIGLTQEQEDTLRSYQFAFNKDTIMVKAELEIAKLDLMQEIHGDKLDEMKVRGAAKRLVETKAKKIQGWVEAKINLRKVLTEEQKTKAKKIHFSHH